MKVFLAIVVFVGGFFSGNSFRQDSYENEESYDESLLPAAPRAAPAPLKWDGVCPKKAAKCPNGFQGTPPLILISLDGLRPDYLKRGVTPTINNLAKCGAMAESLYPVYPSKTFPNHYSIVTGLYPSSHGVIDNNMYDPFKRRLFKFGTPEAYEPFWYQKEPIWVTAEKQGKKTASFFWPGSDVKIDGIMPTYYQNYSAKLSFDVRVDQVLQWLDLPQASRPSFFTLYVNQPDNMGHKAGTKSPQISQVLMNVDNMISRLYAGLQQRNLVDCVNVVILSDHGLADVDCRNVVDIQKYMNASEVFSTMGPLGRLRPKGRRSPDHVVADIVNKLRCQSSHMRVYPKEQAPVRMHYADNARIEPILLDMDNGWTVVSKGVTSLRDDICSGGAHGYDNVFPDMRAIFLAHGPSIKKNVVIKPFINTELYEFFTELMNIRPNPNNGTKGSLHSILKSPKNLPPQKEPSPPAVGQIPKDSGDYETRVKAADCSCPQAHKQVVVNDLSSKRDEHVPFGVPYSSFDNSTMRLLYNDDYLLAFDLKYKIPMWTAFTLNGQEAEAEQQSTCFVGDARIPFSDTAKCSDYNNPTVVKQYIFQRPLFPPEFSSSSSREQSAYVTNSIPKSMNHTKVIEKKINKILRKWAAENRQLNVIMGSAFDLHATGLRPDHAKIIRSRETHGRLVVPTHIFVIATWCSQKVNKIKDCESSKLVSHGFLLPNLPYAQNCESGEAVILKNVARVVDIEKLTGFSFYTGLPTYDAIRLRTMMPQRSIS